MTDLPHEAYLGAMSTLERVGPATLRRLLSLGPPDQVWSLIRAGRIPRELLSALPEPSVVAAATWPDQAAGVDPAQIWDRCERTGVGAVSLGSPGYPAALAQDPEPPVVLFHIGDPDVLAAPRAAIVGTRRATGYGLRVARDLGLELARAGVCVVSGLALGIDAAAHRGAVTPGEAGAGAAAGAAAVVGGGLDAPGPVRNAEVARAVAATGVLLSEVPPGVQAVPWRFPVRNRILAGLAQVLVVVESAPTGGSMLTVQEAQVRDRPVLAVPGPIDSHVSLGTNQLIEEGASVCSGATDVLLALGMDAPGHPRGPSGDPRPRPDGAAAVVLDQLGWRPCSIERLAVRTGLDLGGLSRVLGQLERSGWAERRGGFVERVARSPDSATVRGADGDTPYRRPRQGQLGLES